MNVKQTNSSSKTKRARKLQSGQLPGDPEVPEPAAGAETEKKTEPKKNGKKEKTVSGRSDWVEIELPFTVSVQG